MNIIVSGGREYNDWDVFSRSLLRVSIPWKQVRILSCHDGECDSMSERFGSMYCSGVWTFPLSPFVEPDNSVLIRNMDIVSVSDGAVLFWDGKDPRIKHLISVLKLASRKFLVFDYYGNLMDDPGGVNDSS